MIKNRLTAFVSCLFVLSLLLAPSPARTAKIQGGSTVGLEAADNGAAFIYAENNGTRLDLKPPIESTAIGNALVYSNKGKLSLFVRDGITGYGVKSQIAFSSSKASYLLSTNEGGILEFVGESGRFDLTVNTPGYKEMKTFFYISPNEELKTNIWMDRESSNEVTTETETKSTAVIQGYVVDGGSGKPLEGVDVYFTTIDKKTETNQNGYFQIESEKASKIEGDKDDNQLRITIEFTKESFGNYAIENFLLVKGVVTLRITLEKGKDRVLEKHFQGVLDKQNEKADIDEQHGNSQEQNFHNNGKNGSFLSPQSCPALPTTIRVGTGCPTSGGNPVCTQVCTGTVQTMSLESYVQSGLDNEWISSWLPASLQAGAVAYRTYGAYYVINHPLNNPNYDIRSDTCNQAWGSGTATSCINAANATVGEVIVNSSNVIVKSEYSAENNNSGCGNGFSGTGSTWPCISDNVCSGFANSGHGRGMCQSGSSRWASQGQVYTWILDHYYNPGNYFRCGSSCALTSITPTLVSPGTSTGPGPTISTLTPILTWNPVSGATNYGVYVRDILSNTLVVDNDCASATANYTVPSGILANNRQYRWNIRANTNCSSCTSQFSSVLFFQTPASACNAPGSFSLISPTNGQSLSPTTSATLSWGTSANADSYDVYFGTSSNPPFVANQTGLSRAVSVSPGQTYFWKVVARVNCNSSLTSTAGIWSFSVQQTCNAPGSFSLSSPANGQSLSPTTSTTLSWGTSANADSYDVYFGTSSNPPFIANQSGTSRSVSVSPGSTYFWKVVARVNCNSSLTSTAGIWSFSVQQTCNAPGSFSLSLPANGQSLSPTTSTTLSWGTSANADSYDVYFGTSSNPPFIANQSGTSRSVSVSPGQTYFWQVVARVNCNSSFTFTTPIWSFFVQSGGTLPDLVVTSFTASTTGTTGAQIMGATIIANQGSSNAGAFRLGFYFSTDNIITTGDTFTGWVCQYPSGLGAGQSTSCTGQIGVPPSLPPGTYYVGAIVDDQGLIAESNEANNSRAADTGPVALKTVFDFDGDGKTDLSVFRPSDLLWYIIPSATGSSRVQGWGFSTDVLVPGDYDGDGKTDLAVWRPSEGIWYIINSSTGGGRVQGWGVSTDIPVPGDYDGDGKTDLAIWRPSEATWYIIKSSTGSGRVQTWGLPGDKPVPGDYDGDGKTDLAIWRPSDGTWYIINSSTGSGRVQGWGLPGDKLVPGDYDGDGKTDLAVWRPSDRFWYIINSSTGAGRAQEWGLSTDKPVPGDYDGDGKTDLAVWRPSDGIWYIINSSTGAGRAQGWGLNGDTPVPSVFVR